MIKSVKRRLLFVLVSLFALSTICVCVVGKTNKAYAATNKQAEYSDEFAGSKFGDKWTVSGATLENDYYALALIDFDAWGVGVNLANHAIEKGSTITFDANFKSGQWLGLAFGLPQNTSRFLYAESAIIMYTDRTRLMRNNGVQLDSATMDNFATLPKVFGEQKVCYTVKIVIDDNGDIAIHSGKKGTDLNLIGKFSSAFVDGYMGFGAMGNTSVDVYSFEYKKGDTVVYSDDFKNSKLGYQTTGIGGNDWYVTHKYGEENAKLGAFNSVKITNNGYVKYSVPITDNANSENIFESSFDVKLTELNDGAYFGVGLGMDKDGALNDASFIGIGRRGDSYFIAHVKYGKVIDVKGNFTEKEVVSDSEFRKFTMSGKYGKIVTVSFLGNSYDINNVDIEGYFAVGCISDNGSVTAYIDNFDFTRYFYNDSSADDMAIDFKGVKEEVFDGETYYDYYVNKNKFYIGSNITLPKYKDSVKQNYLIFSSANANSAFIPKNVYSDAIVRFNVRMARNAADTTKYARFGVGFGLTSYYFSPTSGSYVFWQNQSTHSGKQTPTLMGGVNMDEVYHDASTEFADSKNEYLTCEYDMWQDTETIYNFMIVAENNSVKIYFKSQDEDESKMQILRAEYVNANIYGAIAIFGNTGASFYLSDVSITNISPNRAKDGDFTGYLLNGSAINASDNLKVAKNENLTTKDEYDNSLTMLKLKSAVNGELKLSFNGASVILSESGVSLGNNVTIEKNSFDFGSLATESYLRLRVYGNKFYIGVRHNGSENQLYDDVLVGTLTEKKNSAISISSSEDMELKSAYIVSMNTKIDIVTENYDAEEEAKNNRLVIKPQRGQNSSQDAQKGCKGSVSSDLTVYIVLGIVAVVIIGLRRKEKE